MMSIPAFRPASRLGAPLLLAAGLPFLLSGCEAEAVELAQEITAARGDCTAEALRRSDEECVQMMGRYAEMGTDLVHTYIGGLKALDIALDRMPPVAFDTAGLGYAISPELRAGDPFGAGASPRLTAAGAASRYSSLPQGAAYDRLPLRGEVTRPRPRGSDGRDGTARPAGPRQDREGSERWHDGRDRDARWYGRSRYGAFGYGRADWWGYGDAYRYLESGPEGYFNSGPYAYFYRPPYGYGEYGSPYGYGQGSPYGYGGYGYRDGYGDPYSPSAGYGYGYYDAYGSGYAPGGGYRYGYGNGYDPRGMYGYGYDAYGDGYAPAPRGGYGYGYDDPVPYGYGDVSAPGVGYRDPYGYDTRTYAPDDPYGRGPYDSRAGGVPADRTPAGAWGYDPVDSAAEPDDQGLPPEGGAPPGSAVVPVGPAPQRPGILLPPEQRLRRPWLDD